MTRRRVAPVVLPPALPVQNSPAARAGTDLTVAGATWLLRCLFQLLALLFKHRFAAELDFVALQRQHLYQDLIAFFQLVAHVANAVLGDLADMQQTVGAG